MRVASRARSADCRASSAGALAGDVRGLPGLSGRSLRRSLRHALLPRHVGRDDGRDGEACDEGDPKAAAALSLGEARLAEGLLARAEPRRVLEPPTAKVLEEIVAPEQAADASVRLPLLGGGSDVVPDAVAGGVLALPLHDPGPGGEERLVNDLDVLGAVLRLGHDEEARGDQALDDDARDVVTPQDADGARRVSASRRASPPRSPGGETPPVRARAA